MHRVDILLGEETKYCCKKEEVDAAASILFFAGGETEKIYSYHVHKRILKLLCICKGLLCFYIIIFCFKVLGSQKNVDQKFENN